MLHRTGIFLKVHIYNFFYILTDDAENVTNVGHKNDEQIDNKKETQCNRDVTHPMEGLIREQKLKEGSANLKMNTTKKSK